MGRRSSLREHFERVKTLIGLERFRVQKFRFWGCFKSAENRARSSLWVGGDRYARIFVYVKTHMGLEQFEVGKSRYSYDFPFKSCLGNGRCRPVNSIAQAKICLRVSRMTQGVIRPPSFLVKVKRSEAKWSEAKRSESESCYDLAENRAADSLWVGDHRYTSILCASKLLWV